MSQRYFKLFKSSGILAIFFLPAKLVEFGRSHFKISSEPKNANVLDEQQKIRYQYLLDKLSDQTNKNHSKFVKELEEYFIQKPGELPRNLSPVVRCRLAFEGSWICEYLDKVQEETNDEKAYTEFAKFGLKLNCLKFLPSFLKFMRLDECNFEDLLQMEYETLQLMEVRTLLKSLLTATKKGDFPQFTMSSIQYLLKVFKTYRPLKDVTINMLKIISLISNDKITSQTIANSNWIQIFASILGGSYCHQEERILAHKIAVNLLYSLNANNYILKELIYELYRPNDEPILDIVLIHGFRGGVFRTWRQKNYPSGNNPTLFWPKDWLPKDINSPIRILAVDYGTRIFNFRSLDENNLANLLKRIQKELEVAEVGRRPTVFVCHSLGGLILKHLLIDNSKLLSKTIGVIFITTPHKGTPLASSYPFYLINASDEIKLLIEGNESIERLNEAFVKFSQKIPVIYSVLETDKTHIYGRERIIVPPKSANLDCGLIYHVKAHHHLACKPESRESEIYGIMLNFIRDCINQIKK